MVRSSDPRFHASCSKLSSKISARHSRRQSSTTIPGLDFSADQTNLTVPAGLYLNELAVGIGFQKCVGAFGLS